MATRRQARQSGALKNEHRLCAFRIPTHFRTMNMKQK